MSHVSSAITRLAQREAEQLLSSVDGARAVVIATIDGFDVALASRRNVVASRLAAMSSAIAAMGDVVSQESELGRPRCIVVDADDGYVIVRGVEHAELPMVINVLTDRSAMLGMALRLLQDSGQRLAAA